MDVLRRLMGKLENNLQPDDNDNYSAARLKYSWYMFCFLLRLSTYHPSQRSHCKHNDVVMTTEDKTKHLWIETNHPQVNHLSPVDDSQASLDFLQRLRWKLDDINERIDLSLSRQRSMSHKQWSISFYFHLFSSWVAMTNQSQPAEGVNVDVWNVWCKGTRGCDAHYLYFWFMSKDQYPLKCKFTLWIWQILNTTGAVWQEQWVTTVQLLGDSNPPNCLCE